MPKTNLTRYLILLLLITSCLFVQAQEDHPLLEYGVVYSSLPMYNLIGGLDQMFVYMDNADVTAKFNFNQLFHWEQDFSIFLYGLGNHGDKATDLMGDFQVAGNIQAPRAWRLFEVWAQQNFLDDKVSILIGLYDLNSEFDVLRPGTIFINSSFGIGAEYAQSGLNGPSIFPVSSFGTRWSFAISKQVKLKVALLDGVPGSVENLKSNQIQLSSDEGALIAFETSYYTSTTTKYPMQRGYVTRRKKVGREHSIPTNDKINVGGWYYTSSFPHLVDSLSSSGNFGVYAGVQKYWFYSNYDDRYIALFARYGIAAQKYNQLGAALSGGVVFASSTSEATDYVGIGFSTGINGDSFGEQNPGREGNETVIEITYSFPFRRWITVQPDIQYVINPSSKPEINNPLAVGLLIQVSIGGGI